jgi:glycine/D-amino acid oxidase-like deaminating enzyme
VSVNQFASEQQSTIASDLDLEADVLVIGGGPAGAWAAYNAAAQGGRVVLVDKGYCGSSGATASSGTTVWYAPSTEERENAIATREALSEFLSVLIKYREVCQKLRARAIVKPVICANYTVR